MSTATLQAAAPTPLGTQDRRWSNLAVAELAVAAIPGRAVVEIDAAHADVITRAARDLAATHPGPSTPTGIDDEDLLARCRVAAAALGADALGALHSFRDTGSHDGVLLLRGMPVDRHLPATPRDGMFHGDWRDLAVSTLGQLMVMGVLGDVIAYADEKQGRLVQDVVPLPGSESRQENSGTALLELHTEDGFHPNRPDFLSLFGLRSDHDRCALTVAAGLRPILSLLASRHRAALRRPEFRMDVASSFVGDRLTTIGPLPVFAGPVGDPRLCVDFHAMHALTTAGRDALDALRELLRSSLLGTALAPGDLLIVDNRRAVHGRTGFRPRFGDRERWLRRCFAVDDIAAARSSLRPGSRVHAAVEWMAP